MVLLWWGSVLAFRGELSFGSVILFNFILAVYQPLYELGTFIPNIMRVAAVERLKEVLRTLTITDKQTP